MIELLIVATIIPLIVGAISAGLLTILNLQSSVKNRITDSSDAQVVSSTFIKDVQSATSMTTLPASSPQCDPTGGTQLLGLEWAGGQTVVSYEIVTVAGDPTTYSLVREYCSSGLTATPSSTTTVAYDISGSQVPPCLTGATCTPGATQAWTAAASVPAVKFVVTEAGTNFVYTLLAESRAWTPAAAANIPVGPAFSPLTVLSSGAGLTLGNYSSIKVNPSPGTNASSVAIASPNAGSVSIGTDAALTASTLMTTDPLLNSMSGSPPTEYFSPQVTDPLSSLSIFKTPPPLPSLGASCAVYSGSTYHCGPGIYASNPNFVTGNTYVFTGLGNYEFQSPFVVPSGVTITFDLGNYTFNALTAISGPTAGTTSTITGNNALFYIPNGSVDFGSNSSVYLAPNSAYDGVTVWDASASTVNIENIQSDHNSYGGIYIPGGTVNATSSEAAANTALSVMFLIANNITLQPYTNVIVTGP